MIETIVAIIFVIIIIAACCGEDESTSTINSPRKTNTNTYRPRYSNSECPSCGDLGYDGYCEECGYPDINQGWIGEEYG